MMLTKRQFEVLEFLAEKICEDGVCPSIEEIMAYRGTKSKGNVHWFLERLRDRGFITWKFGTARSIRILKLPPPLAEKYQVEPVASDLFIAATNLLLELESTSLTRYPHRVMLQKYVSELRDVLKPRKAA